MNLYLESRRKLKSLLKILSWYLIEYVSEQFIKTIIEIVTCRPIDVHLSKSVVTYKQNNVMATEKIFLVKQSNNIE
jgi:hypothetical protein